MREPRLSSMSMASWICRKRRSSLTLSACSSKRRRRLATSETLDASSSSSSWASLSGDLLPLIGWRLLATSDLLDYVRFRAVCPHWRSSTLCPRGRGIIDPRFHPRRWMMLPEGHGLYPGHRKLRGYIRFFNTSTGPATLVRSNLHSLFKDHSILNAVDGLLLLHRDEDTAIRLLHPFTGDIAEFPPTRTLVKPGQHTLKFGHLHFGDVSAASLSVSADGVITLMIALFGLISRLAFAHPGIRNGVSRAGFSRPCAFTGQYRSKASLVIAPTPIPLGDCSETPIFRIDPPPPDDQHYDIPPPELIATCPSGKMIRPFHLAECNSEILLIGFGNPSYSRMVIYRLADLILGKVVPLTSIGEDNVILISESCLSVSSRVLPNVEGNSIVTVNQKEGYFGQYHLGSSTWSPVAESSGSIYRCVTGPRSFICHVFTCCHRSTWKTGAISFQFKGNSKDMERKRRLGI